MDHFLLAHSYGEALCTLKRLARSTLFLPDSTSSNIQILGVLEAAGIPYDGIWVTGLHREAWPEMPKPNPFIPIKLQKQQNCPRSSPQRELAVAQSLTHLFARSGQQVIFSYPKRVAENETRAS